MAPCKTKQDTGTTHLTQMIPASQSTLHVMLFVRHIAGRTHLKQIPQPCHLLTVGPGLPVPLLLHLLHDLSMLLRQMLKPGLRLC